MKKKGPITAEDLHIKLIHDPKYIKRLDEFEKHQLESKREYTKAAQPLLNTLASHGFHVEAVGELIRNHLEAYRKHANVIVPLLLEWLPQITYDALREDIIRTLTIPWAKSAAKPLIKEFRRTSDSNEQWVIGNALEVIADDSVFQDIIDIVTNKRYGNSRTMVVLALGNMKNPENKEKAIDVLIKLLDDEDVIGHGLIALRKLNALKTKSKIEQFLSHPTTWIRNEAKKAVAKFEKIERK